MLDKYNIKCVKNNIMCGIDNRGWNMRVQKFPDRGSAMVEINLGWNQVTGYSFTGIGMLPSSISIFSSHGTSWKQSDRAGGI